MLKLVQAKEFNATGFDLYGLLGCNRRCVGCMFLNSQLRSRNHMSVQLVREIATWATASGSPFEEGTLLGGEFALHPEAKEIIKLVAATRRPNREYLRVRIVTNGCRQFRWLLDDAAVADIFRRGHVNVSLESADKAVNDQLRGRGAYQDVMDTIMRLHELGVRFTVNTTVSQINREGLPKLFEFAETAGAVRVNLHWMTPAGNARINLLREQLSWQSWHEVLREATAYQPERPDFVVDCQQGYIYEDVPNGNPGACAIRDRTNLQFYPPEHSDSLECRASSCGMRADDGPTDGGYIFQAGGLRDIVRLPLQKGAPENHRYPHNCGSCPLSSAFARDGHPMVCIYHRVPPELVLKSSSSYT